MIKQEGSPEVVKRPRGGNGTMVVRSIYSKCDLPEGVRLFARVSLMPGARIGVHRHEDEMETYYVVSGKGIFIDDDGSQTAVRPGAACTIYAGQQHGMINDGNEELVMVALVLSERYS